MTRDQAAKTILNNANYSLQELLSNYKGISVEREDDALVSQTSAKKYYVSGRLPGDATVKLFQADTLDLLISEADHYFSEAEDEDEDEEVEDEDEYETYEELEAKYKEADDEEINEESLLNDINDLKKSSGKEKGSNENDR